MIPSAQTPAPATLAELNDAFRKEGKGSGRWLLTSGVQSFGETFVAMALLAVRAFDRFTSDNDPYGEHDFGSFDLRGQKLFWKIDYYDLSLTYGSEDPCDPTKTQRVLTVMLASEY